ncbi:hypothetical protein CPC16_002421, partial [Podila verticillata]
NTKDHYRDKPPTKTKDDPQQDGDNIQARRISMDVLKAPFAWNRRRRTNSVSPTIVAPLIKFKASRRPVTVYVPSEETDHGEISKTRGVRHQQGQAIMGFTFPPRGSDEILKSSRYYPNEDGPSIQVPKSAQTYKTDKRKSLNPFLDNDSDPQLEQQTIQAPEAVIQIGNAPRRRHSEFSGLSMEGCSRLPSHHKQAQVPLEGDLWEDVTASQPQAQHYRYLSAHHTHTRDQSSMSHTSPSLRARRSTIVARSPSRSPPQTYQLVDPAMQTNDITKIKPFGIENKIDTNYDPWANVARNISAGNFSDPHPTSPHNDDDLQQPPRPWNCKQGSRRSSQSSYAQEFSSADRYRPHIWANNNNSSNAPSISSSASMPTSVYDDENWYVLDRTESRVKFRYREMKEIQLRPYGQDDEDEVADEDDATEGAYHEEFHPIDNSVDAGYSAQDVDALNPYKLALKEDYDASPRASDVALSEEYQQELYQMALAASPASTRIQYQVPDYGHYYPDPLQHVVHTSATTTSIASSGTLKSKGRASLTRTKTVLRQVKRRVSAAAQTVVTQANQALVRKNTESTSTTPFPQEDRQLWTQEEGEETRDEHHHYFSDQQYDQNQYTYSSDVVYHDNLREHEDPTSPMFENHFDNNSGSLDGFDSRTESSNGLRRHLYSASRSSLHKSKILFRQVKRRMSNAAQSMVSHAGSALSWKHDGSTEEVAGLGEEVDGLGEEGERGSRVQLENGGE